MEARIHDQASLSKQANIEENKKKVETKVLN